jgi:hypothetical protein
MRQVMLSSAMPTSAGKNIPAPVGGWNARDPIADMPARDAVFLDNFFPRASDVMLRPGSALLATLPEDTEPGSLTTSVPSYPTRPPTERPSFLQERMMGFTT